MAPHFCVKMSAEKEIKKIADLVPDAGNYNKGTEKGRKLIGKSLKKLGAGRSILIDKDGNVIAGNKTLEGAAAAGIDEVIVVRTTGRQIVAVQRTDLEIGSKKGREMALADNATGAANLSWDLEMMAADGWTEKDLEGWGVDLAGVEVGRPEAVEDDYEIPEEIKTDIVAGDLFEIGEHRLLCGDSTKREDVDRLMGGEKADICVTDPPYGVSYSGKTKDALKIENDALTPEQTHKLWERALDRVLENLKDGGVIYATVPAGLLQVGFMSAMESRGCLRQCMVWDKGQMVLGHSDYHYAHEPILYGWKKGTHYFTSDRTKTTVLRHKKPARNAEHPTMKPVLLWCEMMENSSSFGEICVDPFCGSGTTMVSADQLGRRCYAMEISPKYCQVILDRMRKLAPDLEIKKNGQPYPINKD